MSTTDITVPFVNDALFQIMCIYGCVVSFICMYGVLRFHYTWLVDPLAYKFCTRSNLQGYCDGWAISHFVLNASLGYVYPHFWYLFTVCGIVWEILEYYGKHAPFYMPFATPHNKTANQSPFWYARYEDIVSNNLGLLLGVVVGAYW